MHACGVNASDILVCQDASQKLPLTPGFEVCGLVLESGPKAEGVKVGDRIVGLNKSANGGFAEECIIPSRDVWVVSQNLKFDVGASLLDSYCTALLGLQRRAEIEEGDTVVVTAAAGGLGLAAVDLAANVYRAKVENQSFKAENCIPKNYQLMAGYRRVRHRGQGVSRPRERCLGLAQV